MENFELIAKTFQGLEEVLAQELIELGADDVQIGRRMVAFTGDKRMMYRANFCLRTAVRILKPIKHFQAKDPDDVYNAVKSIDWSEYLDVTTSFAVDTTVYSSEFRNSRFVTYKVKDAIVDYFVEHAGQRPNVSVANPALRLNIHIAEDDCTLSLDSSGESLHLRGYREATVEAPINEVLAAGLIKLSGWKFDTDLIDPFCGSGTILIEAALMARNIYPGIFRKRFGFENWKDFEPELLADIYDDDSEEREFNHKIIGYDINVPAVEATLTNARSAHVADIVSAFQRDIRDFEQPAEQAIIITNPPYGERLRPEDLTVIYKALGDKLKQAFTGGEAWVISSKEELFDSMRLRPSFRIPLHNGSIDCELRKFVSFAGKLGDFRAEGGVVKTDEERARMGEKRRFRDGRERDFSRKRRTDDDAPAEGFERPNRYADDDFEDEELAAQYRNLRSRHSSFERARDARERKERGDDRPDRKGFKPGRSNDRGGYGNDRGGYNNDRKPYNKKGNSNDRNRGGFGSGRGGDRH